MVVVPLQLAAADGAATGGNHHTGNPPSGVPPARSSGTASYNSSPAAVFRRGSNIHRSARRWKKTARPARSCPAADLQSLHTDAGFVLDDADSGGAAGGGPDAVLQSRDAADSGGEALAPIYLFGVDHGDLQPHIGRFILAARPAAVVVETALTPRHGSAPGTLLSSSSAWDDVAEGNGYLRLFSQLAYQLQRAGMGDSGAAQQAELWVQLASRSGLCGEQLAYVAALAVDAELVYGDRPKDVTYKRLYSLTSLADLDAAFGHASWHNFAELLAGGQPPDRREVYGDSLFERLMIHERDAVICASLRRAAAAAAARPGTCVVGVVGAAHMRGVCERWRSGEWYGASAVPSDGEPLVWEPSPSSPPNSLDPGRLHHSSSSADVAERLLDPMWAPNGADELLAALPESDRGDGTALGVRRALLESVVRLQCVPQVMADLEQVLGPVPPGDQAEGYGCTYELYGTSRMLLAALERQQLAAVCGGWRCDMWEVLAPLRAARPALGGPGYAPELTLELRTLNYEFLRD